MVPQSRQDAQGPAYDRLPSPSPFHARSCSCWRAAQLALWPVHGCLQISCKAYREVVQKDPRFLKFFQQGTPVNELGRMNIGSRSAPCVRRAGTAFLACGLSGYKCCDVQICSLQASCHCRWAHVVLQPPLPVMR